MHVEEVVVSGELDQNHKKDRKNHSFSTWNLIYNPVNYLIGEREVLQRSQRQQEQRWQVDLDVERHGDWELKLFRCNQFHANPKYCTFLNHSGMWWKYQAGVLGMHWDS